MATKYTGGAHGAGYEVLVGLEEGLRRTVAWYRDGSGTNGIRPSMNPAGTNPRL